MINHLVTALLESTAGRLVAAEPRDVDAVRSGEERFVGFDVAGAQGFAELKQFLNEAMYHHPRVLAMSARAEPVISDLFGAYCHDSALLPVHVRARFALDGETRAIADYVAGMTDRFAFQEQRRLQEGP